MLKVTPETLPFENELFLRCKNLNEELEDEIQDYNIPDQLNQEIHDLHPSLEQLHKQMECESNHSYHEEDIIGDYGMTLGQGNLQTAKSKKRHHRSRLMSGVNDLYAQGEAENDCFLSGNERDTPIFEAFVTSKPFLPSFSLEQK